MRARLTDQKQRGISFIGLLFVAVVLACVGVVVAQVIPTVIEYQAITKAANKATEGTTVPEVRAIFDRAAGHRRHHSRSAARISTSRRTATRWWSSFAYDREIHLFGPAYLLLKYRGQSQVDVVTVTDGGLVALQARLQHQFADPRLLAAGADAPQLFGRPQRAAGVSRRFGAESGGVAPALRRA